MDEKLNPKDKVLLMRDEGEGNKLKVVKGINKKGKIDAIDPMKAKSSDFLIIDKHADPIENFFKNFFNQAKNPSHIGFYAVTVDMLNKILTIDEKNWKSTVLIQKITRIKNRSNRKLKQKKKYHPKKKKKQWKLKQNKRPNLSNLTRAVFLKANIKNTALSPKT